MYSQSIATGKRLFLSDIYENAQLEVPRRRTIAGLLPTGFDATLFFRSEKRIERSLAVALEIDRGECKSRAFYAPRDFFRHFDLKAARKFVRSQLDARQLTMRAHSKLTKAELT